jgi:hypothetical protein
MPGTVARARRIRSWPAAVFCAALIFGAVEASAQATTSELHGVVLSHAGDPLGDVAVSISTGDLSTRTDPDGRFSFAAAPWGQVRLRVRALGHAPLDTLLLLQSGTTHTVRLQLRQFVPQLDTVRVEATLAYGKPARYRHTGKFDDFYERRAKRPGSYFTREDIERSGRSKVSDILLMVPGVTFQWRTGHNKQGTAPHLRVARCVAPVIPLSGRSGGTNATPGYGWFALYIDGQRIRGDPMEILGNLATTEVETIEVYRGPSQLPLEAMGDACAAMFITTRYTPGSVLGRAP